MSKSLIMVVQLFFHFALISTKVFSAQISSAIIQEQCGVMSASAGPIQNSSSSKPTQFPWIAIISIKNESTDSWDQNGSGSLLSRRLVLVKSRYVAILDENNQYVPISRKNIQVFLGTTKYDDLSQEGSVKIGVLVIRLYPQSRRIVQGLNMSNYAILTLNDDATYSDVIKPVCLWDNKLNSRMHPGQQMIAVGYGIDMTGQISNTRKHIVVQVTGSNECATEYQDLLTQTNESRFFCIKEIMPSHGPCKFDTQLYVKIDSVWYLRGEMIARKDPGTLQCHPSSPVAVEDIAPYTNWIYQEIMAERVEIYFKPEENRAVPLDPYLYVDPVKFRAKTQRKCRE